MLVKLISKGMLTVVTGAIDHETHLNTIAVGLLEIHTLSKIGVQRLLACQQIQEMRHKWRA